MSERNFFRFNITIVKTDCTMRLCILGLYDAIQMVLLTYLFDFASLRLLESAEHTGNLYGKKHIRFAANTENFVWNQLQ